MLSTFLNKIKNVKFSNREVYQILIVSLIVSLISSFRLWGDSGSVDVIYGFQNLILHFIFNSFVICVFIFSMKYYGSLKDLEVIFHYNKIGILFSFLLALGTNGILRFYALGFINMKMTDKRLGKINYKPNIDIYSKILFSGIISLIILLFLSSRLPSIFTNQIIILGICSLIPFPKNFGLFSVYSDFSHHLMMFLFFILVALSFNFMPMILSISFSIIVAFIISNFFSDKLLESI